MASLDAADARLATMRPWVLADLLRDVPCIAERLFQLRSLLPHMDVTILASQQPNLLLKVTTPEDAPFHGEFHK